MRSEIKHPPMDVELFHGTVEEVLSDISIHGLRPKGGSGADDAVKKTDTSFYQKMIAGDRALSVYMTPDPNLAASYADFVGEAKKARPVILKIRIPKEEAALLETDEKSESAVRFVGTIKPEWIMGVVDRRPLGNVEADGSVIINLVLFVKEPENEDVDHTLQIVNEWIENDKSVGGANCGIGSGGFQPGNKCAKGGGSTEVTKKGETLHRAEHVNGEWTVNGKPVPPHLRNLGIAAGGPKALINVYMNLDPKGMLLAKGEDVKGRIQPKYSPSHNSQSAASKFGRVRELRSMRAKIFKELEADSKNPKLKEQADCLNVIMKTGMRPGSTADTGADYKSYGATTLEGRHVIANKDGTVTLRLVTGKNKGNTVDFPITDKKTAKMLIARSKQAGPDGKMFNVSAAKLTKYSQTKDGGGFKTKDHRTALGTEIAAELVKKMGHKREFETFKEYRAAITEVSTAVSNVLGNTPTVAEKSYIDLTLFGAWSHPPAPAKKTKSSKKKLPKIKKAASK